MTNRESSYKYIPLSYYSASFFRIKQVGIYLQHNDNAETRYARKCEIRTYERSVFPHLIILENISQPV